MIFENFQKARLRSGGSVWKVAVHFHLLLQHSSIRLTFAITQVLEGMQSELNGLLSSKDLLEQQISSYTVEREVLGKK